MGAVFVYVDTAGADKAYDVASFVADLRAYNVTPAECRAACRAPRSCVSSGLGRRFLRRGSPATS